MKTPQTNSEPLAAAGLLAAIIAAQDEYIELLGAELNDVVPYAGIHHWQSTRYQAGCDARCKIEALKQQAANVPDQATASERRGIENR